MIVRACTWSQLISAQPGPRLHAHAHVISPAFPIRIGIRLALSRVVPRNQYSRTAAGAIIPSTGESAVSIIRMPNYHLWTLAVRHGSDGGTGCTKLAHRESPSAQSTIDIDTFLWTWCHLGMVLDFVSKFHRCMSLAVS